MKICLYRYYAGTNQLKNVHDATNNSQGYFGTSAISSIIYQYDANGNMTRDLSPKNLEIDYNYLNLPDHIDYYSDEYDGSISEYYYDATGKKLVKHFDDPAAPNPVTTYYLNGLHLDAGKSFDFYQTEEGRIAYYAGGDYIHEYTISDHLGNSRASFNVETTTPALIQRDDYYPFGLTFNHWNQSTTPGENLYKFQSQEEQKEPRWYSFKWRNADPALGRFFNVDPLSEKYMYNSPYAFSENDVISAVELHHSE